MAQPPRTLFNVLLEQPWWISALVGLAFFAIARAVFEPVAPWVALPFLVIAAVVGWKQMRTVSPGQVDARLQALRNMHWENFRSVIIQAYQREGFEVIAVEADAYDFRLTRNSRVTLLQCRRWKVNQMGVGPLQDLVKIMTKEDASNGICITAGSASPNAAKFAAANAIAIVSGAELATLVGNVKSDK
jgi:restriction system protein